MEDVGALFGDARAEDDGVVVYGPYTLNVAPKARPFGILGWILDLIEDRGGVLYYRKAGCVFIFILCGVWLECMRCVVLMWLILMGWCSTLQANTLLADQLFSPALLLAEQIELGRVHVAGRTVLELGAGTGLPSLLAAAHGAARVVASDYPDELILRTLKSNVAAAGVHVVPFEWGTDPAALLELAHPDTDTHTQSQSQSHTDSQSEQPRDRRDSGFDTLLLSDLLHFASSHSSLLTSLTALLARTASARAYVACGRYTAPDVCARFVAGARARGLVLEEWAEICGGDAVWEGASVLRGVGREGMGVRKRNCRIWEGRWERV